MHCERPHFLRKPRRFTPFAAQRALSSDPRSCTRPKARCSPCAYKPTTPFLADKRLTLFPLNVRFVRDPGSCPRSKTRCSPCANNNKTTNQQSTTNNKYYSQILTYPPLRSPHPCYQGSHSRRSFLRHIVAWPEQIRTTAISRHTLRTNYNTMEKNGLTL